MTMKTGITAIGIVLIIVALILGIIQHFVYNVYGNPDYRWYFYGALGVIGLIGIIIAAWGLMKKESPPSTSKQ